MVRYFSNEYLYYVIKKFSRHQLMIASNPMS
uniref:Uncharacterized protein n=1 Tax=Lepeophtheirus salmonis TaxID=72036 RepID=A0A0K2TE32_LEPSM